MSNQGDMLGMPSGADALELVNRGAADLPEEAWAPALAAMVAVLNDTYQRMGLPDDEAARMATAGVLALAEYFGGRMFYLPRGERLRNALRNAEIYHRARRGNIRILADEYGLTDIHVYRICREQRELHLAKVQGRFDFGVKEER